MELMQPVLDFSPSDFSLARMKVSLFSSLDQVRVVARRRGCSGTRYTPLFVSIFLANNLQ